MASTRVIKTYYRVVDEESGHVWAESSSQSEVFEAGEDLVEASYHRLVVTERYGDWEQMEESEVQRGRADIREW